MIHITIERECGSGGTQIAKELSERCGIPCYGTEIPEKVSEALNMPVSQVYASEENVTGSFLYSLYMLSQSQNGNSQMLSDTGRIFVEEQQIIQDFAKQGSAIFLGHCACEALKDFADVIKVFIHADKASKYDRIITEYNIPENEVEHFEKKHNKRRSSYYSANTHNKWNDYRCYDIVLDSSKLGVSGCVNILEGLLKAGNKNGRTS